jgi:osmoprotectant transport system permease protein
VTVAALIGRGGLGYFILTGFRRNFTTSMIVGAVLSVILAVAVDALLLAVERMLTPWARRRVRTA